MPDRFTEQAIQEIDNAIEVCNEIARLRLELLAIRRRLRESAIDTPLRPSSQSDIEAAFENASAFARGEKKP